MPFYLRPSAPTAGDALICGDPARALAIAQHVMIQPRMSNHNRGLWGYHGETPEGLPLTVQATGIGGPSAVAVLSEAIELGIRRLIRVGTCASAAGGPGLGETRIVDLALADDGASRALGSADDAVLRPDPRLTAELVALSGRERTTVRSVDVIGPDETRPARDGEAGSLVDHQSAAVLSLCRRLEVEAAVGLVVRSFDGRPLHDDPLDSALLRLADDAVAALRNTRRRAEG